MHSRPIPALAELPDRFWKYVDKRADGCWVWTGTNNGRGYGRFSMGRGNIFSVHRLSVSVHRGPIPEGAVCDHLCRNTLCVNPDHIEVVSQRDNVARGRSREVLKARAESRTHCKHGHELTPETTYLYRGCRACLTCREAYRAQFNADNPNYFKERRQRLKELQGA